MGAIKEKEGGIAVKEIYWEIGVSQATFYNCKEKYSGMKVSDVVMLKELEKKYEVHEDIC